MQLMNMEGGLRPPENFFSQHATATDPGEVSRSWKQWLRQFELYLVATEKNEKSGELQVATLLTLLGSRGVEILESFNLPAADQKDVQKVKAAFTEYFEPRSNEVFERFRFYSRVQLPDEAVEKFLTALRSLASVCNFDGEEKEKALRDRLVMGVRSDAVRKALLQEKELTLEKAADICRCTEATSQYMTKMAPSSTQPETEEAVAEMSAKAERPKPAELMNCKFCAEKHRRGRCSAFGKLCSNCGKANHLAKCCYRKRSHNSDALAAVRNAAVSQLTDKDEQDNGEDKSSHTLGF